MNIAPYPPVCLSEPREAIIPDLDLSQDIEARVAAGHLKRRQGDRLASLAAFEAAAKIDPGHSGVQIEISNDLRELGRFDEAEALLQRLIAREPTNTGALIGLGHLKRRQDDRLASLAAFEAAAKIDPGHSGVQIEISNDLRELGRFDEAEALLQRLIAREPTNTGALIGLGHLKRRQDDRLASLAAFEAAAKIGPGHSGVQIEISNDLRELGRFDEAEALLQRLIAREPTNTGALIGLGHLKRRQGDRLASLAAFEAAAKIDPGHSGVQIEISNDLRELGRFDEAEALLQRLIAREPTNTGALIGLGHLKRRQDDRLASLAAFEAAAKIDPGHSGVQIEISNDLRELGRFDEAEALLQRLIAREPTNTGALIGLGHLKRRQDDRLASLAAFEAAAKIGPGHSGVQIEISNDLRELGRFDEAEALLQRLIAREPTNTGALIGLGHLKRRQGDRLASLAAFEAAAKIVPGHSGVQIEISNDLRELGRFDEAEALLQRLIAREPTNTGALIGLGHLKRRQDDRLASLAAFEAAAKIDPGHSGVQIEISNDLRELGRFDEAEALLQRLIAREPTNTGALIGLGHLKRRQDDRLASLAAFEAAAKIGPGHSGVQIEISNDLRELGRFDEAEALLQRLIAREPTNTGALIGLGHLKRRQGDRLASLAAFEAAAKIDPGHIGVQIEISNDLRGLGQTSEAITQLEHLLQSHSNNVSVRCTLASHLISHSRLSAAYDLCKTALGHHPRNAQIHLMLGYIARQQGKRYDALSCFEEAHKIDPTSNAIFEISAEHRELGNFLEADGIIESVITKNPANLTAILQKAYILRKQCDRQTASQILQTALKRYPNSAQIMTELAVEFRALGRPRESIAMLQRAIEAEPTHFGALEHTAEHFLIADELESSLEVCNIWIETHPHHPAPFVRAGRLLFELGRMTEAFAVLDEAERRLNHHPDILAAKIDGYRRLRDWAGAGSLLTEHATRHSGNFLLWTKRMEVFLDSGAHSAAEGALKNFRATTLHELSRIDTFKGKLAEARWQLEKSAAHYREALRANKDDAGAHAELARTTLKLLDIDGARHHLRRQKEIHATENILKGNSSNISQTHIGQLIDEFALDAELLEEMRMIRQLEINQQITQLRNLILKNPDYTPASIMLMIALRQCGRFDRAPYRPCYRSHAPRIPARIIQYWDTNPPEEISDLMRTWKDNHPSFEYLLFNDATAQDFIRRNHSSRILDAYLRSQEPAQRADIFRLACLSTLGGFYADADDRCLKAVTEFVHPDADFVAFQEDFGTLGNNFLAATPKHPVIQRSLELAGEAINRGDADFLWLATGPGLLTRAFGQYAATEDGWSEKTVILNMGELQSHVGIHCQVRYKRTSKHWSRSSFHRKPSGMTKRTEEGILEKLIRRKSL
ncbi:tetratricopeptide repeat protein [Bradyrhizobium sp. USDA 3650]